MFQAIVVDRQTPNNRKHHWQQQCVVVVVVVVVVFVAFWSAQVPFPTYHPTSFLTTTSSSFSVPSSSTTSGTIQKATIHSAESQQSKQQHQQQQQQQQQQRTATSTLTSVSFYSLEQQWNKNKQQQQQQQHARKTHANLPASCSAVISNHNHHDNNNNHSNKKSINIKFGNKPIDELRCLCDVLHKRIDLARKDKGNTFDAPHRFALDQQRNENYLFCVGLHTSGSIVHIFPRNGFEYSGNEGGLIRQRPVREYFQKVLAEIEPNAPKGTSGVFLVSVHDSVHMSTQMLRELWTSQAPLVTWNARRTQMNYTLLIPDLYFLSSGGYAQEKARRMENEMKFEELTAKVVWRGSSTGLDDRTVDSTNWNQLPRAKLCLKAREFSNLLDAKFSALRQVEDSAAKQYQREGLVAPEISSENLQHFQGQIDIDGNANSWSGCFQKLLSPGVMLKVEGEYVQWYYNQLKPWEHYVPVKEDLSDLREKVEWLLDSSRTQSAAASTQANGIHEKQKIATQSTQFAMGLTLATAVKESARQMARYFYQAEDHPLILGMQLMHGYGLD